MAALVNGPFNAQDYNPQQGTGQLDPGKHKVIITKSEVTATKNNDGGMVVFTVESQEGPSQGQQMNYRINLYNASADAVRIAQQQFSALCHVVGVFYVEDTQQLHGIPFYVDVRKQKNDERYNEIFKVYDANGNEPSKNGPQGGGQQQQQQNNFGGQQQQQQQQPGNNAFGNQQQQNNNFNQQQNNGNNNQSFGGGNQQQQQQQQNNNFGGNNQQSNNNFGGGNTQANNGGGNAAWQPNGTGNTGGQPAWGQQG